MYAMGFICWAQGFLGSRVHLFGFYGLVITQHSVIGLGFMGWLLLKHSVIGLGSMGWLLLKHSVIGFVFLQIGPKGYVGAMGGFRKPTVQKRLENQLFRNGSWTT